MCMRINEPWQQRLSCYVDDLIFIRNMQIAYVSYPRNDPILDSHKAMLNYLIAMHGYYPGADEHHLSTPHGSRIHQA